MLKKIIDDCEHRPHLFKICFTLDDEDGNAVVRFYHDSEMKRSELLALDNFRQIEDEMINTQVSYRINSLKQKTKLIKTRMNELQAIIQQNNPNLNDLIVRMLNSLSIEDDSQVGGSMVLSPSVAQKGI